MSLLRLLTTGKSLVGVQEAESRYRMTSQRLLPHFGSGRNPFGSQTKATAPASDANPGEAEGEFGAPREERRTGVLGTWWGKITMRVKGCATKAGGVLKRPAVKPGTAAVQKAARVPVQGELSLDRIKVVRNDLTDSDLEVVQMRRSPTGTESGRRSGKASGERAEFQCSGEETACAATRDT